MTAEIIAFNIYDAFKMSVLNNFEELYPAYKVKCSVMEKYLLCNARGWYSYHLIGLWSNLEPWKKDKLSTRSNFAHNFIWSQYLRWLSILKNYFITELNFYNLKMLRIMSLEKTRFNPSILVKVWHNRKPYWPFPQSRYIFKRVKTSWMSCIIYQQVYSVINMY